MNAPDEPSDTSASIVLEASLNRLLTALPRVARCVFAPAAALSSMVALTRSWVVWFWEEDE